jgi:hypothetical protein
MLMSLSDFLPGGWKWLLDHLWWEALMAVPAGVSWVLARYHRLSPFWQWTAFSAMETLLGAASIAAVSRFGVPAAVPAVGFLLLLPYLVIRVDKKKNLGQKPARANPGPPPAGPIPQPQSGPQLPPGFAIRAQEMRHGSNPLASHILWLELNVSTSIRGHLIRFTCNGPIYREACRFLQQDYEIGATQAGPETNSVVLRVGPRAFSDPGILTAQLASIAPLKLIGISDEPYFDEPLRGHAALMQAEVTSTMPATRSGFDVAGARGNTATGPTLTDGTRSRPALETPGPSISAISRGEIKRQLSTAPLLRRNQLAKDYAGLRVTWECELLNLHEQGDSRLLLHLWCDGASVRAVVLDAPGTRLLREGDRLIVTGTIAAQSDSVEIVLEPAEYVSVKK